jgi:hypothetical protein
VNGRDDILPFITDNRFESNGDPELAEFVGEEERVGIGPAPDQQLSADRDSFCINLVHLVCLVCLVHLVGLVQPNKQDKPNKPNNVFLCSTLLVNLAKI